MKNQILSSYVVLVLALAAPCFAQQRFDSAEAAVQALLDATEKHDTARLAAIFGPQGNAILTSGNPDQDRAEQTQFSDLARAKYQLVADPRDPGRMILSLGQAEWPFPVPVVRANGKWRFDASQGQVEMQARRIGAHELDAIEICAGYVEAQRKYASEDRDHDGVLKYATHMMGGPDGRDALYKEGSSDALVPRGFAEATWDGPNKSAKPYHGYFFRILDGQGPHAPQGAHTYLVKNKLVGGFGLIAWPAEYGVTGIHTFMVNQDGVIFQKDAGPPQGVAAPITRYDPDPSWTRVDER